jgi:hypothetical protein
MCNVSSNARKPMFRRMNTVSWRRNEGRSDAVNDDLVYSFSITEDPLNCPDFFTRGLPGKSTRRRNPVP